MGVSSGAAKYSTSKIARAEGVPDPQNGLRPIHIQLSVSRLPALMTWIRNIIWGVAVAWWFASLLALGTGAVFAVSSSARAEVTELGGALRFLGSYFAVATTSGLVLGALRPLASLWWGRHLIGGIVAMIAFGTQFLVLGFEDFWGLAWIILPLMFVAGVAFAPLWYNGVASGQLWLPDFAGWLDRVRHTTDASGRDHGS